MLTSPIHGVGKRRNIGVGEVCYTVGRNTVGDVGGNAGSNANIITATSVEVGDIDNNKKEMQNHKIMQYMQIMQIMRAVMQISLPQPRPRWETLTATTTARRKCKITK